MRLCSVMGAPCGDVVCEAGCKMVPMPHDAVMRACVARLKRLGNLREPPYELPADSFLEAAVRDIWAMRP